MRTKFTPIIPYYCPTCEKETLFVIRRGRYARKKLMLIQCDICGTKIVGRRKIVTYVLKRIEDIKRRWGLNRKGLHNGTSTGARGFKDDLLYVLWPYRFPRDG